MPQHVRTPGRNGPFPDVVERVSGKLLWWLLVQCRERSKKNPAYALDGNGVCTRQLAEFAAVRVYGNRDVCVGWRRVSKRLLDVNLSRCRIHEVDTSDDVRDSVKVIVNDYRQVIGDEAVPSQDNEIA